MILILRKIIYQVKKDDEWNLKILELLNEGRLEDVAQCAREFAREANGDMQFKGILVVECNRSRV